MPPRLARWLLAVFLGPGVVGRSVLGDLDEEFAERARLSPGAARWWYRREAAAVVLRARSITLTDAAATDRHAVLTKRTGDSMMRMFWSDLRGAVRTLAKQPRFTVVSALTLALGIGAVTAIFSVVNGILLKPLPSPVADRLVNVWSTAPGLGYNQFSLSPDIYAFYDEHNDVFEEMGIFQARTGNLTDGELPEVVDVLAASPSYFSTIGATFSLGRPYSADEDLPDAPSVAVVSHRYWTRQRASDPDLVGKTLRLDGEVRQIVGIAPAWLDAPQTPDVWIPTGFDPENMPFGNFAWNAVARLKDGATAEQAAQHLEPLVARAMEEAIQSPTYRAFLTDGGYRPLVHPVKEDVIGSVQRPLWILLGTVGLVLLIACANVANLFLIRAEGRQREIAVRTALGGSRLSLMRRLMAEALVLAAIGTIGGVAVSASALPSLLQLAPATIPRLDQVGLDATVIVFAVGMSIFSALAFGLIPAIRYTRPAMLGTLRHGGRGGTDEPARRRGRNLLVIAQTAMALVLLVGSGLLVRSFGQLMSAELGFEPQDVLTFRVDLNGTDYPEAADVARFGDDLRQRLTEMSGVTAVGAATVLPVATGAPGTAHQFEGQLVEPGQLPPMVHYKLVTAGYFDAMEIDLLAGRDFDSRDTGEGVRSIIANASLAELYWPGEDPLGKRVRIGGTDPNPPGGDQNQAPPEVPWYTVVGVVDDVLQDGLRQPVRPLLYYTVNPENANPIASARVMTYVVRGRGVVTQAEAVSRTVWSLDGALPIAGMRTMVDIVETSVVEFSFTMLTLAIAAGLALVLGAIGLYGVLSYAVSMRMREIGVRLALGAPPSRVMRSVVANGAAITGIGLVVGILGAVGLTRFLGEILFETEPLDIPTFAAMSAALFVVALLASYLPARKAAAVSPMESMRSD